MSYWDQLREADFSPQPAEVAAGPKFTHEPVPLDTFITDKKYLANPPLSDIQYAAVRQAERIFLPGTYAYLAEHAYDAATRRYWGMRTVFGDGRKVLTESGVWIDDPVLRPVNFLTLQWGKGSGKDHICRVVSTRIAFLLLCLDNPQEYYSMPGQDTIHLLNVASSSRQASQAFFTPMRRIVTRPGNWFENLGVEAVEARRGPRRQEETTKALQDSIRFAKHVEAISGHSDAETQEGLNLLLGIADEIDVFRRREELLRRGDRESSRSAEGIIEMLRTSARTRFPEAFKNIYISWPRYKGSMIQSLTASARTDNTEHGDASEEFVSGPLCTWEVNPRVPGRESFAKDYKDDPIMAAAKYECRPSRALNPFFSNEQAIEGCLVEAPRQPLELEYELHGNAWQPVYDFSPTLRPVRGALYAMHADLAVTGDKAGVAMAHVARWQDVEVASELPSGQVIMVTERRPVVVVDFVISYSASTATIPPREIQIRWARLLALELRRRHFRVCRFTFDQYQSQDSMQILARQGIETDRLSTDLTTEHWRNLRDLFSEDRIRMVRRESLLTELYSLTRLTNGRVDHPPSGSKDEADALAGAAEGALELGGEEELDKDGNPISAVLAGPAHQWFGAPAAELPIGFSFTGMGWGAETPQPVRLDGIGLPVSGTFMDEEDPTGWSHDGQP